MGVKSCPKMEFNTSPTPAVRHTQVSNIQNISFTEPLTVVILNSSKIYRSLTAF